MKYRNKNYIDVDLLPFILVPTIAITMGLTLLGHGAANHNPPDNYPLPKTSLLAGNEDLLADTSEFKTGDEALFNFTGDTVLVLSQPDSLALEEEVRVLRRTPEGNLEAVDLPENWIVKLPVDTVAFKMESRPANDKLLRYNRAAR
jgi:hypothetical protein